VTSDVCLLSTGRLATPLVGFGCRRALPCDDAAAHWIFRVLTTIPLGGSFELISRISSHPTVFFSHSKPANVTFSCGKPAKWKRTTRSPSRTAPGPSNYVRTVDRAACPVRSIVWSMYVRLDWAGRYAVRTHARFWLLLPASQAQMEDEDEDDVGAAGRRHVSTSASGGLRSKCHPSRRTGRWDVRVDFRSPARPILLLLAATNCRP
jgi:hypothetical protein